MPQFRWNADKDRWLQAERQMFFAQLRDEILAGHVLAVLGPSNLEQYAHQCRYVVACEGYTWCIPAVIEGETVFFITAWPDRRLHRRYTRR